MRLRRITLQNLRNLTLVSLDLVGRRQFFVGANGQGKTNLLEAVGFITALRSFRTSDSRLLIAHGQSEGAMSFELEHETLGDTRVTVRLRAGTKEVTVDNERVAKLTDYLGKFPTVVFSSQDQQLIRGAPAGRRRWLDLTLGAMDMGYVRALQEYHRALAGRNALLKRGAPPAELAAFERPLASRGRQIVAARRQGLAALASRLTAAYARIAPEEAGDVGFVYSPNVAGEDEAVWLEQLSAGRARDLRMGATWMGPHRDDFDFTLGGRSAVAVASEGQQRSLVLALKAAQADWYHERGRVEPVILADDVLGELDPMRRERFWRIVDPRWQVLATGTTRPATPSEPADWTVFSVAKGMFRPADSTGS